MAPPPPSAVALGQFAALQHQCNNDSHHNQAQRWQALPCLLVSLLGRRLCCHLDPPGRCGRRECECKEFVALRQVAQVPVRLSGDQAVDLSVIHKEPGVDRAASWACWPRDCAALHVGDAAGRDHAVCMLHADGGVAQAARGSLDSTHSMRVGCDEPACKRGVDGPRVAAQPGGDAPAAVLRADAQLCDPADAATSRLVPKRRGERMAHQHATNLGSHQEAGVSVKQALFTQLCCGQLDAGAGLGTQVPPGAVLAAEELGTRLQLVVTDTACCHRGVHNRTHLF
mmetsp:Transcript_7534/g.18678  ORF Transcript_7534/g.18678 Transcript_7534/m.18678 type:complete len:284 (+) Transcript_7534:192-1043(+)